MMMKDELTLAWR